MVQGFKKGFKIDSYMRLVITNIEKFGWHVQAVGRVEANDASEDEEAPGFGYSVGLSQKDKPELIISGLPFQVIGHYINMIGKDMTEKGKEIKAGDIIHGYVDNDKMGMAFIEVSEEAFDENMCVAGRLYDKVPALQCVWCDTKGKFPWDEGFEEKFRPLQELYGKFK